MARLGQLCVSIGLAFLVASSSVTACSSTDTPAAEPVSPTTAATTQISTDVTEPTSVGQDSSGDPLLPLGRLCWAVKELINIEVMRSNDLWNSEIASRISEIENNPEAQELFSGLLNQDLDIFGGEAEAVLSGEVPMNEVVGEEFERVIGNTEISTLPTSVPEDTYTTTLAEIRNEIAKAMVDPNLPNELQGFADTFFELMVEQAASFDINTYDIEYVGEIFDKFNQTDRMAFDEVMRNHPEACGL